MQKYYIIKVASKVEGYADIRSVVYLDHKNWVSFFRRSALFCS